MESEWETRKDRINPKLRSAGWEVVTFNDGRSIIDFDCCAVSEYPTDAGPADYALCLDG